MEANEISGVEKFNKASKMYLETRSPSTVSKHLSARYSKIQKKKQIIIHSHEFFH